VAIACRGLFAILLSATLLLAGCIVLPIPTGEDKVLAGTPVAEAQLTFVEPGVTTQAEVVERLGQPALVWEDARVFVYRWDMRQGILLWAVGAHVTGAAGKTDLPSHHQLLIRFDEAGRVQRFEHRKRPSGVSVAQSIRAWLGLMEPAPAGGDQARVPVLVRIDLTIDGVPETPFPRPTFTVDPLFAFGLGDLETAERLSAAVRHRYLSEASRSAGWFVFDLAPGTWYLGMIGPDSNVASSVSRFARQAEAIPRWRIDVPGDARAVYAGTLRVAGRAEGKLMFGNRIVRPVPGFEPLLVDESPLAAALLAAEAPQAGPPRSALMQRWRPGEPLVFRSPLPAPSAPPSAPSSTQ
jgi:outer membrane protein assembly factor BamE (lipoprotein component of BamABCDE complex)